MTTPVLQPKLILGLRTEPRGNALFVTDDDIVYPVGGVLAIHNHLMQRQKSIKLPERGNNVISITISPNRQANN